MTTNKLILNFLCIVSFLFLYIELHAQNNKFRFCKISSSNSLSNNFINDIVQDKHGFLWFSTQSGLNKYDGYSYKIYNNNLIGTADINEDVIRFLKKDQKGNLWAIGNNFNLYNDDKDAFIQYSAPFNIGISDVAEDNKGNFWFVCDQNKIIHFDVLKNKMINLNNKFLFLNKQNINILGIDRLDNLWIYDGGNLFKVNLHSYYSGKTKYKCYKKDYFVRLKNIYELSDNKLLLGNNYSAGWAEYSYNDDSIYFVKWDSTIFNIEMANYSLDIRQLIQDNNKNIWIATYGNGLFYKSFNENRIYHFTHDVLNNSSIPDDEISSIIEDKSGVIWIATVNGACSFNRKENSITQYNTGLKEGDILKIDNINCVNVTDNILRIGGKGLTTINLTTNEYSHFDWQPNKMFQIIYNNNVNAICPVNDDYIYIGGYALYRINFKKNTYEYALPDTKNSKSLSSWVVWKIHKGQKTGNVWIGTFNGLSLLESIKNYPEGNKGELKMQATFKQFHHDIKNRNSLVSNNAFEIFEDTNGFTWIGTDNGLSCYNIKTDSFINYTSLSVPNLKQHIAIKSIFEDHTGHIWIGTEGLGLLLLNKKNQRLEVATITKEAKINTVWGIAEDDQYNLWISTVSGIIKFQPSTLKYRIYDKEDGFLDNGFRYNNFCKGDDGRIYVAGANGINAFYPKDLCEDLNFPDVLITGFNIFNKPIEVGQKIDGKTILSKNIINTKEIVLTYKQKVFSFEFLGLHFSSPSKNHYQYILDGFDKEWNNTTSDKRLATYTNLSPGNYTFKVKASNSDNIWNPKETILKITILPAFWQTWWFRILVSILFFSSLILVYLNRIRKLRNQNLKLEKIVRERTQKIDEKNHMLEEQTEELTQQSFILKEVNNVLNEQKEELSQQADVLQNMNSELNQQKEELTKLNATKDKFFSIIGHDLKNPFQGIMMSADILKREFSILNDEEKLNFIEMIEQSSKGAYGLLENLLYWARTQTGTIFFKPETFDLFEIADQTIGLLIPNAQNKGVLLKNEILNNFFVTADKNMITTIIRNLMNNAIKFTEAGGSVKISSIRKEQIVSIIVSDTGVGMTESTRNKLFRIDQHITEKGTSGESGTGLGLIICKEFVDKHNGKVFAESEIGKGSRFIISIPNQSDVIIPEPIPSLPKQEDVLSEIIPAIKKDKEGILTNKTILIVEDNNNIRINIKNIFQGVCDVLENDNGKDGYDTAIDEIPDLIISDVLMPLMDGFEMCEKLKTDERTSHIPIIILTSKSSDQSKMHGLETGADDYITKPFNANLLFIRVVNLIKSRQELRKRFAREIKIEAREVTITSIDEKFLQKAIDIVEKNITDSVFDNEQFTLAMAMSRTQLYRKLKAVTGFSATEFIRTIRLKRAAQLLEKSTMRINEVAFSVGFSNPNYFYISFSEMFGMTPSEYAEKNKPC